MSSLALTLAIGDYDRTGALKTGAVRPQGVDLNILTLSPEEIFYRMGRFLEFDACEFSLSTYTIRRGRGEPMIAIPVCPSQMFRHSSIFIGDKAGIREPKDLRDKRVGVPKYHMTAAVWIRGLLEDEYGVAPKDIRWFEGGEGAKVKEVDVTLPPDVRLEHVPDGKHLGDMVAAGELDAFIGARRPAPCAATARRRGDVRAVDAGYVTGGGRPYWKWCIACPQVRRLPCGLTEGERPHDQRSQPASALVHGAVGAPQLRICVCGPRTEPYWPPGGTLRPRHATRRTAVSSTSRVRLHLKPGQKGTKQLVAQYGDRLICVRYRYDAQRKKRF